MGFCCCYCLLDVTRYRINGAEIFGYLLPILGTIYLCLHSTQCTCTRVQYRHNVILHIYILCFAAQSFICVFHICYDMKSMEKLSLHRCCYISFLLNWIYCILGSSHSMKMRYSGDSEHRAQKCVYFHLITLTLRTNFSADISYSQQHL